MAEKFRFMDPVQLEDGTYDREYNAQEFTDYFKALVTTGVMKSVGAQLKVSANGTNMVSTISNGIAFLLGRYYENDDAVNLTHDTESLGNSRIDRVVIRMDLNPDKRHVLAFIKKGTPSPNPVPPTLTQTQNVYEISLAQVRVVGGQTFIATNAVTDERGTSVICPWAGSNILPSFDDNALAQHINDNNKHFSGSEKSSFNSLLNRFNSKSRLIASWDNAIENGIYVSNGNTPTNTYSIGIVLVDDIGSNIVQKVIPYGQTVEYIRIRYSNNTWSPWKKVLNQDDYDQLFTSVSNGKATVNQAVTDMGVYTAPDAPFATTAANIRNLSNIKAGTGTITSDNLRTTFAVSGLPFKPRAIMLQARNANIQAKGMYNEQFTASEFLILINGNGMNNTFSVFQGGFNVSAAYPNGTGLFDYWAIK